MVRHVIGLEAALREAGQQRQGLGPAPRVTPAGLAGVTRRDARVEGHDLRVVRVLRGVLGVLRDVNAVEHCSEECSECFEGCVGC